MLKRLQACLGLGDLLSHLSFQELGKDILCPLGVDISEYGNGKFSRIRLAQLWDYLRETVKRDWYCVKPWNRVMSTGALSLPSSDPSAGQL